MHGTWALAPAGPGFESPSTTSQPDNTPYSLLWPLSQSSEGWRWEGGWGAISFPDRSGGRIKSGHVRKSLSICWGTEEMRPQDSLPPGLCLQKFLKNNICQPREHICLFPDTPLGPANLSTSCFCKSFSTRAPLIPDEPLLPSLSSGRQ